MQNTIKAINEQTGETAKKIAFLEKDRINGLESSIKAINEKTGTNTQKIDKGNERINSLENSIKAIN